MDKIPTKVIKLCSEFLPVSLPLRLASVFQHQIFSLLYKTASVTHLLKNATLQISDRFSTSIPYLRFWNVYSLPESFSIWNCHLTSTAITLHIVVDGHSTATADYSGLWTIYDVLSNETRLTALHQSTAFDCINIPTLVRRLEYTFDFSGTALQWLASYLSQRQHFVRVGDCKWRPRRQLSSLNTIFVPTIPQP